MYCNWCHAGPLTLFLLCGSRFSVFGVGSSVYGSSFNAVGRAFDQNLSALGARPVVKLGEGDQDEGNVDEAFASWAQDLLYELENGGTADLKDSINSSATADSFQSAEDDSYVSSDEDDVDDPQSVSSTLLDLEDLAGKLPKSAVGSEGTNGRGLVRKNLGKKGSAPVYEVSLKSTVSSLSKASAEVPKEMVTPLIRASLEKQVRLGSCSIL